MRKAIIAVAVLVVLGVADVAEAVRHVRPPSISDPPPFEEGLNFSEWMAVFTMLFTGGLLIIAGLAWKAARAQLQANAIFALEERWTGERLERGRIEITELSKRVSKHVRRKHPHLTEEMKKARMKRIISIWIFAVRGSDPNRYRHINAVFEFFETLGATVFYFKTLKHESVAELFAGPISMMNEVVGRNIRLQNGPGPRHNGPHEHMLSLFDDTETWLAERHTDPP